MDFGTTLTMTSAALASYIGYAILWESVAIARGKGHRHPMGSIALLPWRERSTCQCGTGGTGDKVVATDTDRFGFPYTIVEHNGREFKDYTNHTTR